jgi:hypothetical protein
VGGATTTGLARNDSPRRVLRWHQAAGQMRQPFSRNLLPKIFRDFPLFSNDTKSNRSSWYIRTTDSSTFSMIGVADRGFCITQREECGRKKTNVGVDDFVTLLLHTQRDRSRGSRGRTLATSVCVERFKPHQSTRRTGPQCNGTPGPRAAHRRHRQTQYDITGLTWSDGRQVG